LLQAGKSNQKNYNTFSISNETLLESNTRNHILKKSKNNENTPISPKSVKSNQSQVSHAISKSGKHAKPVKNLSKFLNTASNFWGRTLCLLKDN
jgi:hypothetical protein